MMLNLGTAAAVKEREWLSPGMWAGPAVLSALLLAELIYILVWNVQGSAKISGGAAVDSREVGITLFGPYLLGVELASLLLLAGLVGACHLGWHTESDGDSHSESLADRRHEHG
jgi:NADH-quinone oxidoreductase subunit J